MEIYLFEMLALIAFVVIVSVIKVITTTAKWLSENWHKLVMWFAIICLFASLVVNCSK